VDYSEIINTLNSASGFDLFRIKSAIERMLDDPARIIELKTKLRVGMEIEYFDSTENRIIKAVTLSIKRTKVTVKHIDDGACWTIPYYCININEVDTGISNNPNKRGLGRNEVKVGDKVGFITRDNTEQYGDVIRLNQKTVTLACNEGQWRVSYGLLFKIVSPDVDFLPAQ